MSTQALGRKPQDPPSNVRLVDPVDLVRAYGAAKGRQDVEAALACCCDDFSLETVAWNTESRGKAEAAFDLGTFFGLFPDYRFVFERVIAEGDAVVAWGRAKMTWTGRIPGRGVLSWFRRAPREIEIPAVAIFEIRDGRIRRERFVFDQRDFCRQLGVSTGVFAWLAGRLESRRHRVLDRAGAEPVESFESIMIRGNADRVFAHTIADPTALMHCTPPIPWLRPEKIEIVGEHLRTDAIRRVRLINGQVTDERITSFVPGRRLHYRIETGWGAVIDTMVADTFGEQYVEEFEGSTRLCWRARAVPRSGWMRPVVRLLMRFIVTTMQRRFLRAMKHQLETAPAPVTDSFVVA